MSPNIPTPLLRCPCCLKRLSDNERLGGMCIACGEMLSFEGER